MHAVEQDYFGSFDSLLAFSKVLFDYCCILLLITK